MRPDGDDVSRLRARVLGASQTDDVVEEALLALD
jgi:hypothetical protein